jgi:rubredoxin
VSDGAPEPGAAPAPASPSPTEARCPACDAPPSPGRWCMACGAEFPAAPAEGTLPPGGSVAAKKYACDGCGALMLYDAASGGLKCPFCGGTKGIERDPGYVAVEHALESLGPTIDRAEAHKTFSDATVASRCPFCGAEHVVERQGDPDRIRPASVLPFAVALEAARERFVVWLGKGIFRPRSLRTDASEATFSGVYVPFWTFDAKAWSRWTAQAGWHYTVTVPAGNGQTRTETRTRWEPAAGERTDLYDDVLVAASKGLDERLLAKVEPFRLAALQPYRSDYLSGWLAEEYVVDLPEGWRRAREEINEEQERRCAGDVPGDTHANLRVWTQHGDVTWKHLLLPLWISSYRFHGKVYTFLVNGQTGRVAGRAPVSPVRVAIAVVLGVALALGAYWLFHRR